jgi:hypothetical protein
MKRSKLVVCLGILGMAAAHAAAQSGTVSLRQIAFLKASNPGTFDHFGDGGALPGHNGHSIAASRDGSIIAVGAAHEGSAATGINGNQNDDSVYNAGAVYVFARNGNAWTQQAYVKASNTGNGDHFGSSVALSADAATMVVTAPWEASAATGINGNQQDDSISQAGAVYVFTRSGDAWTQQAYIKASNTGKAGDGDIIGEGDQFGSAIALSDDGNTLAVSAVSEDANARGMESNQQDDSFNSAGAVYIFTRTGGTWTQQAYLKADASTNTGLGDQFGFNLSMSADGNTLAVGVYDESGGGRAVNAAIQPPKGGSGAAYVFVRSGGTWTKQAYLKAWNSDNGDSWGSEVALSGDGNTLAMGALDEDCMCGGVFTDPKIGADDQKADTSSGAAAVFVRNGTAWSQQAYIKPSNPSDGDQFGIRLALAQDGNVLVVGAQTEDGSAQGINGPQNDEAIEAGAVYVYTRTGSTWTQQAYVKGSNTEEFDEFGGTFALTRDGSLLIVGARGEDSASAANPADNSVDEAGAAYVFSITR